MKMNSLMSAMSSPLKWKLQRKMQHHSCAPTPTPFANVRLCLGHKPNQPLNCTSLQPYSDIRCPHFLPIDPRHKQFPPHIAVKCNCYQQTSSKVRLNWTIWNWGQNYL